MLMLGLLVLGPQRLHAMLGHVARAKAELENAARGMKSQLATELEVAPLDGKADRPMRPLSQETARGASTRS
jgi:Sec-independent protein translocase protein TatA